MRRSFTLLSILTAFSAPALADTIYVDPNATGGDSGESWVDAHTSLQRALDRVRYGDEIWVAAGEFFPTRRADNEMPDLLSDDPRDATFWIPRGVRLIGGFVGYETSPDQREIGIHVSTLNGDIGAPGDHADNAHRVVLYQSFHGGGYGSSDSDQIIGALIDGFRVINGNAQDSTDIDNVGIGGGGLLFRSYSVDNATYAAKIDARNCEIAYNRTDYKGAGMSIGMVFGTITDCHFHDNFAMENGGGLSVGSVVGVPESVHTFNITGCSFVENTAVKSGGAFHQASANAPNLSQLPNRTYINNCVFLRNTAQTRDGGAIWYNDLGSNPASLFVSNSLLAQNSAGQEGGAIFITSYIAGPAVIHSDAWVFNCTIADNTAGVAGGALYIGTHGEAEVHNSILWGNTAPTDAQINDNNRATLIANIVDGGFGNNDFAFNTDIDPRFFDPANDDYSLRNDSPAINAAWDPYLPLDIADLDRDNIFAETSPFDVVGTTRRLNAGRTPSGLGITPLVDYGAYERCNADMNRDGRTDFYDVTAMIRGYLDNNPDADLNADGQHSVDDLLRFLSSFDEGC